MLQAMLGVSQHLSPLPVGAVEAKAETIMYVPPGRLESGETHDVALHRQPAALAAGRVRAARVFQGRLCASCSLPSVRPFISDRKSTLLAVRAKRPTVKPPVNAHCRYPWFLGWSITGVLGCR